MDQATRFPDELDHFLNVYFGHIVNRISLSGVAGASCVIRLQLADGNSVIVKSSPTLRERHFYEQHADLLRRAGIGVPDLYWSGSDEEHRHWTVLEYIPIPFPRERWVFDTEQYEMLFRLHSTTWGARRVEVGDVAFQPKWNTELTGRALAWFDGVAEHKDVREQMIHLQREAQFLFEPLCCLSADPNPTNWRIRENGELILMDWERFCHGHPAIDLAITMPGIGSKDGAMERTMAEMYIRLWQKNTGSVPTELDGLERAIRVAKLWSMVEFIANAKGAPALYPHDTVAYIVREWPSLFDQLL